MLTQAKQYPVFTLSFPSILMKGSSLAIHKAFRMENSHSCYFRLGMHREYKHSLYSYNVIYIYKYKADFTFDFLFLALVRAKLETLVALLMK